MVETFYYQGTEETAALKIASLRIEATLKSAEYFFKPWMINKGKYGLPQILRYIAKITTVQKQLTKT